MACETGKRRTASERLRPISFSSSEALGSRPVIIGVAQIRLNFSGVSTLPRILCSTSLDACILRIIFGPHSFGTWQSGQVARTPVLDSLAARGTVGRAGVIPEGMPPGSDVGNMSILGYDPAEFHTGRAPIEAASLGRVGQQTWSRSTRSLPRRNN